MEQDHPLTWINWHNLEANIPLEQLPEFHREFLASRGVKNPDEMPLRRVQQSVERELNTLRQAGQAKQQGDELLVLSQLVPSKWLKQYV